MRRIITALSDGARGRLTDELQQRPSCGSRIVEFQLLRFAHLVGLILMGAGLIGVFVCDMRSRQVSDLNLFAQAVSFIALFYDA